MKRIYVKTVKRVLLSILNVLLSMVSFSATYYVSATGNDTNTGLITALPWKSLGKVNSTTFKAGDQILFKCGDTFYGTITVNRSGTSGNPITYGSYGTGKKPIITGFTTITGWTNEGNGIYSKVISTDAQTNMVTIDGVQYGMGRYPNSGWLTYESSSTNVSITDNQLSSTPSWTGAEAVISKNPYALDRCLITNNSGSTLTYTSLGSTDNANSTGNYFIQNDLRTLDQFGEWYHDYSGTGKFYMYFGAIDPTTKVIQVATKNNVIVDNASYITIDGLDLYGCINTLFSSTYNSGCTSVSINNSTLSCSGSDAILNYITYFSLENSIITNCNRMGVYAARSNATILNNTISNLGLIVGQAKWGGVSRGIFINSSDYLIQYNHLENIYSAGITFAAGNNNLDIRNNYIENTNIGFTDMGAIYGSRNHSSVLIDGNIIKQSSGIGIYLDEYCNGVTVSNNTISECVYNGIKLHKAHDNVIKSNTCFNNGYGISMESNPTNENNLVNDSIFGNKFIAKTPTQFSVLYINRYTGYTSSFSTMFFDQNYYARPIDDSDVFYTFLLTTWASKTFSQWRGLIKQDANSKKSPQTITSVNDLQFEYNDTKTAKTVTLSQAMMDVIGNKYSDSISLQPFTSLVLMKDLTPVVVPGTPTLPVATSGNTTATVTFVAPANNGGSVITGYTVTSIPSGGIDNNAGSTSLTHAITGLTNGTSYTFTVKATNSVGSSVSSVASNSVIPKAPVATGFLFTGPSSGSINSASSNFTVTPNNLYTGTITITPSGTGSTGLSPIVLTFSNSSTTQTFAITPTVAGSITLTATNNGILANPANLTYTVNAVAPGVPTPIIATAGNTSALVSFVAPADNGGFTIAGYTVASIPAGGIDANAGSTSLTHIITGLTNGTSYAFTVKATNSAGSSLASIASNSIVPISISYIEYKSICDGSNYNGWTTSGKYIRKLFTKTGGDSIVTTYLTVNPLPIVSFTNAVSSANVGSTGNVYTTQTGMSNYQWTVSAGGIITSGGGISNNTVTVTWNTSGLQNVSVNYSNINGCTALVAANYPVTVNALPTAYNVTGGGTYCIVGSGLAVGLSNSQTGVNYQLQLGGQNTGSPVSGTDSAITFGNITAAGTYTVVATNVSTLAIANMTGSASISVNPLPIVSLTSGVSTANVGSTGNVYTTQSGMSNYQWTVSAGGTITSGGGISNNTVTVTWNTAGLQNISVNYSNINGCTASVAANYSVTVNALPTAYNVIGGGTYCIGGSGLAVGLSNSQIGVNYQLQLDGQNTGSAVSGSGSAITFGNLTASGTYTVVATNVSTLATANMTGSASISINPLPVVTLTSGVSSANVGSIGNVYTTQTGMSNYQWTVSAGGTITSGGGISNNTVTVIWNTAGAQSVSVNYSNINGCAASVAANYPVTVNALPTGYTITGGGTYCIGGSGLAVGLSNSQIGINYQLQLGGQNTGSPVSGSGSAISFGTMTVAGTYTIIATNVSTLATSNMTGSASISINPLPVVTFTSGVSTANVGSTGNVYTTQSGMSNYQWTVSAGGTITSGGGISNNTVTVIWNTAGAQSVSVNYSNINGCAASVAANYPVTVVDTLYTQIISLRKGNNLFSTYLIPTNPTVDVVMGALVAQNALSKVQDEAGNSYEYGDTYGGWINKIGSISKTEGYSIIVNFNCTLQVTGQMIILPLAIPLKKGWNFISYPRTDQVNAMYMIQSLIDQKRLVKVQDQLGNSIENIIGSGWVNNIGNFIPGQAYKINVNNDVILTIQQSYPKSADVLAAIEQPVYFSSQVEGNGVNHMNINFIDLSQSGLSIGDEVAAFDGDICVGALKITSDHMNSGTASLIASYLTNSMKQDGFKEGDPIQIYVWNHENGEKSTAMLDIVEGQMSFEKNASVLVQMKSLSTGIKSFEEMVKIDVFPNPTKGKVTVRFSQIPVQGSRIDILDITGRKISSQLIAETSEEFNLDQQPAGIYLVKSIIGSNEIIQKLILSK